MDYILKNGIVVNEGSRQQKDILIKNGKIQSIGKNLSAEHAEVIDVTGKYILPGCIDDQVHFREPGLTHKASIYTESRAAVAGGITSYMEMPNTVPNATTQELLEDKYVIASKNSIANYSFFMGATNDNLDEVLKTDPASVCGIKVFMGSSTGNMLVDNKETLEGLFSNVSMLIATHCEDEQTIKNNSKKYKEIYGENVPMECHPNIRSVEACYKSSKYATDLAKKTGATIADTIILGGNVALEKAIKKANELAFETPYRIACLCSEVVNLCVDLSINGNPSSISDVGVAAESAYAGFKGASMNVLINMPSIENKKLRNRISDDLKIKKDDIEKSYIAAINEINKVLDS